MFKRVFGGLIALLTLGALPILAAPVVAVGSTSLVFTYTPGGNAPPAQAVPVTVTSQDPPVTITGTTVSYVSGGSPGWLSVFPPTAQNTPGSLTFYVVPGSMAAGTYIAQVTVLVNGATDPTSSLSVTVFFTIAGGLGGPPSQTISANPTALSFSWTAGSPRPGPQILAVQTSDNTNFTVSRTTDTVAPWLSVSPTTSTSPGNISVSVDPSNLAAGTYSGTITLTGSFSVIQIPVSLSVAGLGISASPAVVTLNVPQNYGISAPQFVQVTSSGALPFQTIATSDGNWLQVDVPSGTTPATIQIRANTSSLPQGNYIGTVTVRSGSIASTDIGVALTVGPPASVGLQPSTLSFAYTIADPAPAVQTVRINSLSATPQTFALAAATADGGNWLLASANQTTTPAVITVQLNPANLSPGNYLGTVSITPKVPNASPQPIQVSLTVKAPPPPAIQGVTNSASYATTSVAPGEFVTLFGTNIGPKTLVSAPLGGLPRTLGGATVTFDSIQAPILYASATQTSVQVPYGITPGGNTSIVVNYNSTNSAPKVMPVTSALPGLFTSDSSGKGQAAALNADLSVNSASNPVARGSVLVLYGTGEGATTPSITEGSVVPVIAPIPATQAPVAVTIGGQLAQVLYFGETPGIIAGLTQVNVTVPSGTPTGSAVPVLIFVNGIPSQPGVTVAVK